MKTFSMVRDFKYLLYYGWRRGLPQSKKHILGIFYLFSMKFKKAWFYETRY